MPSKYGTKAYRLDPAIVRVLARVKAHGRFLDYNEVFVALVTSYLLHRPAMKARIEAATRGRA